MPQPPELPHRPPMHWLDAAALSDDGLTVTATRTLCPEQPFVIDGYLLPSALIEMMAQTAAAGSVAKHRTHGRAIRQGALVALRDAHFCAHAPVGATITFTATQDRTFGPLTSAHLEARIENRLIASARMTFHLTFE